ncbi:hypothetical protein [Sphingobacterium sp. BN32]|uniref:hypothetical protein n=1 Tax=Sphingobacterium sp. BN32 TaxID=3058432 RepID=UPI00265CC5D1|nr:hypothetical protein [Sphingobacterium sp. BN32]WKK59913.1 hypothetical protein QYC40_06635 [Sphingobacterium sp. BN32]
MSIRDKVNFEKQIDSISLQPNRGIKNNLYWSAITGFVALVAATVFWQQIGVGGRLVCFAIIAYVIIFGIIDITFRLNVRYIFDKASHAVYKENSIFGKRKIMNFEEATIFQSSEIGEWHYTLGIKKKQFLKSYTISPSFFANKASEREAEEYDREILAPLLALIGEENDVLSNYNQSTGMNNYTNM